MAFRIRRLAVEATVRALASISGSNFSGKQEQEKEQENENE